MLLVDEESRKESDFDGYLLVFLPRVVS